MYKVEKLSVTGAWVTEAIFQTIEEAATFERRLPYVTRVINIATCKEILAY